jgi:hypothetical protein
VLCSRDPLTGEEHRDRYRVAEIIYLAEVVLGLWMADLIVKNQHFPRPRTEPPRRRPVVLICRRQGAFQGMGWYGAYG